MDENELKCILTSNTVTSPYFKQVLAQDELNYVDYNDTGFYVVNTDASDGPGKHWTVIAVFDHSPSEFFDSLGKQPTLYGKNFTNFLIASGPQYMYSTKRIQSVDSVNCGHFSIYLAYHRCLGYSFEDILGMFSAINLDYNDRIVEDFISKLDVC